MAETITPSTLDGRTEHGIWSHEAGGFVDSALYTPDGAAEAFDRLVAQGEDADELAVLAFCSEHRDEEQPADGCEECNAEEPEPADEDVD